MTLANFPLTMTTKMCSFCPSKQKNREKHCNPSNKENVALFWAWSGKKSLEISLPLLPVLSLSVSTWDSICYHCLPVWCPTRNPCPHFSTETELLKVTHGCLNLNLWPFLTFRSWWLSNVWLYWLLLLEMLPVTAPSSVGVLPVLSRGGCRSGCECGLCPGFEFWL